MTKDPKIKIRNNGNVFELQSIFDSEFIAKKEAKKYKKAGYLIRVVPWMDKYVLYTYMNY